MQSKIRTCSILGVDEREREKKRKVLAGGPVYTPSFLWLLIAVKEASIIAFRDDLSGLTVVPRIGHGLLALPPRRNLYTFTPLPRKRLAPPRELASSATQLHTTDDHAVCGGPQVQIRDREGGRGR